MGAYKAINGDIYVPVRGRHMRVPKERVREFRENLESAVNGNGCQMYWGGNNSSLNAGRRGNLCSGSVDFHGEDAKGDYMNENLESDEAAGVLSALDEFAKQRALNKGLREAGLEDLTN